MHKNKTALQQQDGYLKSNSNFIVIDKGAMVQTVPPKLWRYALKHSLMWTYNHLWLPDWLMYRSFKIFELGEV
jgi:hypothetical protein